MSNSKVPYLPDELVLEILSQALRWPLVIDEYVWPFLENGLAAKLRSIPRFAPMVNEALFKYNTVSITTDRNLWYLNKQMLPYVVNIELPFYQCYYEDSSDTEEDYVFRGSKDTVFPWLQKLADRQLGLEKLDSFKITFYCADDSDCVGTPSVVRIVQMFERVWSHRPMVFPCKKLVLEVEGHTCGDECQSKPQSECKDWKALSGIFKASG